MSGMFETWAAELDACVAAPEHHRLLLENDLVRVLETTIEPGQTTKVHTHRWPAVYYILSAGHFVRRDGAGAVTFDSRHSSTALSGQAAWSPPLGPHTLENVGETTIRVISVEVKR